jgi:predicted phage gp36 major capsid-like protein
MNRTTTIVLVVLFAALGLYVVLVQSPRDRAAAEATPTVSSVPRVVWETTADQVNSVRVAEPSTGRSVAVTRDAQGAWSVTEPEAGPADTSTMQTVTTNAAGLSISGIVTSTTELAQFGVLSPTYALEIGLADGQTLKASIGMPAPVGGYYLLREGDTNVMVASNFGIDTLVGLLDTPPYQPTPTPAFSLDVTPGTPDGTAVSPADSTPTP